MKTSAMLSAPACRISELSNATMKKPPYIKPEWLRIPEAVLVSGLCRSKIYDLINDGTIKSFSHRKRGAARGQRLISYDSLIEYLDKASKLVWA